jgi:hypothetical protein
VAGAWESEFRERMRAFEAGAAGASLNGVSASLKVRVTSGCFHREHSPHAYTLIDAHLASIPRGDWVFDFVEHESGPEILVSLALATAGVGLVKSVVDLIIAIIQARRTGIDQGDSPSEPVELIARRFDHAGTLREEVVLHIDHAQFPRSCTRTTGSSPRLDSEMKLEPTTPTSSRRRWQQGTRAALVEVVAALEGCMQQVGLKGISLSVEIGDQQGKLASHHELRSELTDALWLRSRRINIWLHPANYRDTSLGLLLDPAEPVLVVVYRSGSLQARETLRNMLERILPPERPDPRRHAWWLGPILTNAYTATVALLSTRVWPPARHSWHVSPTVFYAIIAAVVIFNGLLGIAFTRFVIGRWCSPLERLPDTGKTLWDRRRGWVQFGIALWVALVGILIALPRAH